MAQGGMHVSSIRLRNCYLPSGLEPIFDQRGPIISKNDILKLELWLHPKQVNGFVGGHNIFMYLREEELIHGCLSFFDLQSIQEFDDFIFTECFAGKKVHAWKSVSVNGNGSLVVPYLHRQVSEVYRNKYSVHLGWENVFGYSYGPNDPALRHRGLDYKINLGFD